MSSRTIWRIKNLCSKDKFARASSSIGAGRSGTPELFFQSCVANSRDRIRKERPRRKTDVWALAKTFTTMPLSKEQLLAEAEDLLRNVPPFEEMHGNNGLAWLGRFSAVIRTW